MPERERLPAIPAKKEGDQLELYSTIYELTRGDFKSFRWRRFARKSLLLLILLSSAAGVFFTVLYFGFVQHRIRNLREQIFRSAKRIETLSEELGRKSI